MKGVVWRPKKLIIVLEMWAEEREEVKWTKCLKRTL